MSQPCFDKLNIRLGSTIEPLASRRVYQNELFGTDPRFLKLNLIMPQNNFHINGPVGCLLIHGFTGSPNELLELGDFLKKEKLTISLPTLPGHATNPSDLFKTTWRDWFNHIKKSYQSLTECCEEVFVCGMSMGGTLALHLAAHYPVNGVVALSAPIEFPRWQKLAARYFKNIIKFRNKHGGEDVRDESAKTKLNSYPKYPLYAVDQLFQMLDHVRGDLPDVMQPVLLMHSKNDNTVAFANSEIIFNELGSETKQKIALEESYHIITVDMEKERVLQEIMGFIQRESKILHQLPSQKFESS